MTQEERLVEIKGITSKILELKKLGSTVDTKKTIQVLQQELSNLINPGK
tara:strand:- start:964 stop:1110 length:147 start_codon:yes stop_codon:yes gene_type:complete